MDWKLACPCTEQAEIAFLKDMLSSTQQYILNSDSAKLCLVGKIRYPLSIMYRIFHYFFWFCLPTLLNYAATLFFFPEKNIPTCLSIRKRGMSH
jgi:hypothetical protein